MKIAYFSHYFTPEIGAPSARIYDLSQQWLAQGHTPRVVTCFPNHPTGQLYPGYKSSQYSHETLDGIDVHRHWTYITPNKGFIKKTLGHISYWPSARRTSSRRIGPVDVAIGTSPTFFAAMAAASLARRRRIPFIMEVRDLWPAIFVELGVIRNPRIIRLLEKWEISLYRAATRIVTVTEAFRQDLIGRGIPAEKVVTIPNGADVNYWQPAPKPQALAEKLGVQNKFVVLYSGAHGISQALTKILDSAQHLREHSEIQFVFVGEGAEKDQLVERARQENITNVTFLDPVTKDEVRDFYALADVCLVPLRDIPLFETFIPSKMFEMMAMEKPIVASVRGEAADILNRSGGATVVPPEDSRAIADAILALYNNRAEANTMGKRGRQFVIENYSRAALAATYIKTLEGAIAAYKAAS